MTGPDLIERCLATIHGYWALGNEASVAAGATIVTNPDLPSVYDANAATAIRTPEDGIDDLMTVVDSALGPGRRATFKVDPLVTPALEPRLAAADHAVDAEIHAVLRGDLRAKPRPIAIRPASSDHDWDVLARLIRLDHEDEAERERRAPLAVSTTEQIVRQKRGKAPDVQFFLASVGDEDVAFLSSWPGIAGVGKVEDLFTRPDHRNEGIATALIDHCVKDARARGAELVLIGADVTDTPKRMYAALGFEPAVVTRSYTLR